MKENDDDDDSAMQRVAGGMYDGGGKKEMRSKCHAINRTEFFFGILAQRRVFKKKVHTKKVKSLDDNKLPAVQTLTAKISTPDRPYSSRITRFPNTAAVVQTPNILLYNIILM